MRRSGMLCDAPGSLPNARPGIDGSVTLKFLLALLLCFSSLARAQSSTARMLRGIVIDAETSAPLADVVLQIGGRATRSGQGGEFRLIVASGSLLVARKLGYRPLRVTVGERDSLVIALQPVGQSLEAVIVTAARREQRLADAVVATELVTRQDIERRGAGDVAAALAGVVAVQIEGGVPSGSGALLQGLGSQRVLVLVDGQPVAGRINGNLDLSRISTTGVERIEIVTGPQSTLYGSEAMGGVINIITRHPRRAGLAGDLSATAGSQGRRDAGFTALAMTRGGRLAGTLDAGARSVDLLPGSASNAATFARRADVAPSVTWHPTAHSTLDAAAGITRERQRYRIGQLYQHSDNLQLSARIGAGRAFHGGRVTATLYSSRFDHLSRRSTTPDPVTRDGDRDRQVLLKLDLNGNTVVGHAVLDAGLEARDERIAADRVKGERRWLKGIEPFAQATLVVGSLSVVPGVRVSWSDRWGSATTPRIAMLWRPAAPVALRASVATGYRAPDFKEMYLEFVNTAAGYAVRGNPSLRPEHSTSASARIDWTAAFGSVNVSAFHTRYTDFIEAGETATPGEYSYSNVASGRISGLDVNASVGLPSRRLEASWSLLDPRGPDGAPLLGRARHAARIGGTLAGRTNTRLSLSSGFTGRTPITRNDSGAVTRWRPSRTRVDTRIGQRIGRSLEVGITVDNLLDHRTGEDWPGYDGRLWSVSARVSR